MPRCENLTYNGVTLAVVRTNSVESRAVRTQDDVDYLWTEFVVNVNCLFNAQETSYLPVPVGFVPIKSPGQYPMDTYRAVRHALMQPRKLLFYTMLSRSIVSSPQVGLIVDVNNGPIPIACNIMRVDGAQVLHINYIIKTCLIECAPEGTDTSHPMLSNRFSQHQTINREFLTETVTRGEAYFRTDDVFNSGITPDVFRDQMLPPLPAYFQRVHASFSIATTGNVISYEVRDVEKMYDIGDTGPDGTQLFITHVEGSYTLQPCQADGMIPAGVGLASMNVKIWGSREASNWVLTQFAFQIMGGNLKLPFARPDVGYLRHFVIHQSITDRFVDVTVVFYLMANPTGPLGGFNVNGLRQDHVFDGLDPFDFGGLNPQPWYDNGVRGAVSHLIIASALHDACQPFTPQEVPAVPPPPVTPYQTPYPVPTQVVPYDRMPSYPPKYAPATFQFPYTEASIVSTYETDSGIIQLPIAARPSSSSAPASGPTSSFVTVAARTTRRTVNWTAERIGAPPQIPDPAVSDKNQVLLHATIEPMAFQVLEDGQSSVFRVSGTYVYGLKRDLSQIPAIPFDVVQWVGIPRGTFALDGSAGGATLVHGLIDGGDFGPTET